MRNRFVAGGLAVVWLAAFAVAAGADEESIPLDKVPAAVTRAVKEKFPKGELKKAGKETEDGATVYEIGLVSEGKTIDVSLKPDGKILEIETRIAAKDLPKAVADAIEVKYPKGEIEKAEEITEGDETKFEVLVELSEDETREVVLGRSGKTLEDEASDADEDEGDEEGEGH